MLHHCMQIESAADRYVIYWCVWRVQTIDAHGAHYAPHHEFRNDCFSWEHCAGGLLNQWHVTIDNETGIWPATKLLYRQPDTYSLIRARFFFYVFVNRVSLTLEATRNIGTGLGIVAYLDGNFESNRLFSSRNTTKSYPKTMRMTFQKHRS